MKKFLAMILALALCFSLVACGGSDKADDEFKIEIKFSNVFQPEEMNGKASEMLAEMITEKTGGVVGIKVVSGEEDLLLVTQSGILIRTHVDAIRMAGRATQGVIVMRFKEEGDQVIAMALTDRDPDLNPEVEEKPVDVVENADLSE